MLVPFVVRVMTLLNRDEYDTPVGHRAHSRWLQAGPVRAGTFELSREELGVGPAFIDDEDEQETFVIEDVGDL